MQQWEYGYVYAGQYRLSEKSANGQWIDSGGEYIVSAHANGLQLIKDCSGRLDALNFLGAQGWVISEGRDVNSVESVDWIKDFLRNEHPTIKEAWMRAFHFMRRPISPEE